MLYADRVRAQFDDRLTVGRLYLIDFGSGRILGAGPGKQPAMELLKSQQDHPVGITALDPYSWDVYCLGHLFRGFIEVRRKISANFSGIAY